MIRVRPQTSGRFSHRALSADLKDFAQGCGQLLESILKEEACLTARMAMKFAPPMSAPVTAADRDKAGKFQAGGGAGGDGDTMASRKWGDVAVQTAINASVMRVDESLMASTSDFSNVNDYIKWREANGPGKVRQLWLRNIMDSGDYQEQYTRIKAIFQKRNSAQRPLDSGSLASWHRKIKREWGHKFTNRSGFFSWQSQQENQRFASDSTIKSYVLEAVKKVGWTKSGWVQCIKQIGPVKITSRKYPMGRERVFPRTGRRSAEW